MVIQVRLLAHLGSVNATLQSLQRTEGRQHPQLDVPAAGKGAKVNMKLLTNVPPGDGGEVGWATTGLPSNASEVRRHKSGNVVFASFSLQVCAMPC